MFCIFFMQVQFEGRAVILGTLGAVPGFLIGVYIVSRAMIFPLADGV